MSDAGGGGIFPSSAPAAPNAAPGATATGSGTGEGPRGAEEEDDLLPPFLRAAARAAWAPANSAVFWQPSHWQFSPQ